MIGGILHFLETTNTLSFSAFNQGASWMEHIKTMLLMLPPISLTVVWESDMFTHFRLKGKAPIDCYTYAVCVGLMSEMNIMNSGVSDIQFNYKTIV